MAAHVDVLEIAQVAVGDEDILVAVEVDVEEGGLPGPTGGFEAGEPGGFGERPIAANTGLTPAIWIFRSVRSRLTMSTT
jgi:hypothetical protein